MLSLIVSDAARGVNIAEQYPEYFQRLMMDWNLYQQFLDSLDLFLRSQLQTLEPLPTPPSRDLSFLHKRPQPEVTYIANESGGWGLAIHQSIALLNNLFFRATPAAATRFTLPVVLDEDQWFTFFRQKIRQQENSWTLWLEGTPIDEPPNSLQLALMLIPETDMTDQLPCFDIKLSWGHYQEVAIIDRSGRINFPPVPLNQVIDEVSQTVTADLTLTLTNGN